jgi:5-methylthioadenosine/S-adenosylhomocysteine deaminase
MVRLPTRLLEDIPHNVGWRLKAKKALEADDSAHTDSEREMTADGGRHGGGELDSARFVIRNSRVLDSSGEKLIVRDIVVEDGRIVEVRSPQRPRRGEPVLDASGLFAIPGLINSHTHAHNHLLKGTADCRWLESHVSVLAANLQSWTPRDYYLSTLVGAIEMLKTGTTAAYDMVNIPGPRADEVLASIVQAYIDIGLRAVISPTVADGTFVEGVWGLSERLPRDLLRALNELAAPPPVANALSWLEAGINRWHGAANGRIHMAVSPVFRLGSKELLSGCLRVARRHHVGIQAHALESKLQALGALNRYGTTLIDYLGRQEFLGPGVTLAHAVWVTDDDIEQLARHGTSLVHNPASNLKLGSGIAPVRECLDAGINVALGTDGSASSDNQNMFGALWMAALVSHVRSPDPRRWLSAPEVFEAATASGARAMLQGDQLGQLRAGRRADIVLLDLASIYLTPLNQPMLQLVYAELGSAVHTVLVDGRLVVESGRILRIDEGVTVREAAAAAARVNRYDRKSAARVDALALPLRSLQYDLADEPFPVNRYAR